MNSRLYFTYFLNACVLEFFFSPQYRRQLFLPWIGVAVAMVVKEIIYIMFYLYAWLDGSKYDVSGAMYAASYVPGSDASQNH